jgi:hypothetical protein
MTKRHTESRHGGVLIGLVIAMVAVGVISAGMVRMLRSQAVTASHAYNQMRARYAADSGQNMLRQLKNATNVAQLDLYAAAGTTTFNLANGDAFDLSITKTNNLYLSTILGKFLSDTSVVSSRRLTWQFSVGGSGNPLPDNQTPEIIGTTGAEITDTGPMSAADIDAVVDNEIDEGGYLLHGSWNNRRRTNYERTLDLHQGFFTQALPTAHGSSTKLRTELNLRHAEEEPGYMEHLIWSVELPLDYQQEATAARTANNDWLAYDVQAKFSWEQYTSYGPRYYGAQGLAFKMHGTPSQYAFYAVSFMTYLVENENNTMLDGHYTEVDGNRIGTLWNTQDCIPNDIKPPGEAGDLLLVLWKQWVENGVEQRQWLAYQNLSNLDGEYLQGYSDLIDATLHLRVTEGIDSIGPFIDVQCFVGDTLNYGIWWFPILRYLSMNSDYTDGGDYRFAYDNADDSYSLIFWYINSPFVTWPPFALSDWSAAVDYYTRVVLPYIFDSSVTLLPDGNTLRIRNVESYLSKNQQNPAGELAFIFSGNFLSGANNLNLNENRFNAAQSHIPSLYMAVDDLAVRWLLTESGSEGGGGGGSSGVDIITDF